MTGTRNFLARSFFRRIRPTFSGFSDRVMSGRGSFVAVDGDDVLQNGGRMFSFRTVIVVDWFDFDFFLRRFCKTFFNHERSKLSNKILVFFPNIGTNFF